MSSIRESLTSLLGHDDALAKLGTLIDSDAAETATAVDAAGPVLVGGLAVTASRDDGSDTIAGLLDDADPSILDDVDGYLDGADAEEGNGILDTLFGADRDGLVDGLADQSGLPVETYRELLPTLAPIVAGQVAKRRAEDGLDGEAVAALLASEREGLESDGSLGDWFGGLAQRGLGTLAGAGAMAKGSLNDVAADADEAVGEAADDAEEAVAEAAGDAADDPEEAVAEAAGDVTDDAEEAVAEAAGDVTDDAEEAADDAEEAVAEAAGDVTDDAEEVVGVGAAVAGKAADAGAEAVSGSAEDVTATAAVGGTVASVTDTEDRLAPAAGDEQRGGLGWLWWAVGAVVAVLFLAWLLNQCSSDDDEATASGGAGTTAAVEDTTGAAAETDEAEAVAAPEADLQALVDAAVPEGVTGTVDGDGVTLSGTVDSEEARAGAEESVAGIEGVGSVDNQIEVAAPEADLQALVDAAVPEGVTGTVDGDGVTLSGTVDSEEARAAAEESVAGIEGVGSVDNQIDVAADSSEPSDDGSGDAPAAGSTLNEELGLDPIRFNYLSSRITPESEAVLTEVVAYLEANDVTIEIQGHTDSDGSEAKNIELSTARAEAVKAYLEANGIAADRMTAIGLGESEPAVPNDSADAKAINRRIEFVVTG